MPTRNARHTGRRSNAQQDFLDKPAKRRRRRPASRQHRQEVAAPPSEVRVRPRQTARAPRRPGLVRVMAGLLLFGLVALAAFLFSDTRFYVETAAIRGLHYTSAEEVYRQAGIHQYSIFWLDDRATARRIEALPYVKQATVHSALPNQVRIEIEEREPLVVWKVNGQEYWVDSEGITMPVASQVQSLPVLWDLDGSTMAADGRLDRQLIASLRQVKQQTPDVVDFGYDRKNGLQFRFPDGAYVYLGYAEGMAERVASLLVLHRSLASQGQMPAEINWRDPSGYYLRLAQ